MYLNVYRAAFRRLYQKLLCVASTCAVDISAVLFRADFAVMGMLAQKGCS